MKSIATLLLAVAFVQGQAPQGPPTETVTPNIPGVAAAGTKVQIIKDGFEGTEGPIALPDGSVIFTNATHITKIDKDNKVSDFLDNPNLANALAFDSKGRLIVADRHNHRVQILTKDGKFIGEYDDFGRISGLAIDKNDVIYTADSESTERVHPGWLKGIRIGSLKDGKVTMFVPPHKTDAPEGAMGEGIAIDAAGNLFTAEATLRGVTKYVKN